ncbi:MAG: Uma2 family endonuclease [Anaerolineae bacterium]|nr:Uma2 family endonuclease [Anaerolineae bacterium]
MAVQQKQLYTVEQFESFIHLPENENRLFELIDGEIVEVSPKLRHGMAASASHGHIFAYLQQNPIGRVAIKVDHQIPDDERNFRRPDISYISAERLAALDLDENIPFMPDLAVVVKSPTNYVKGIRGLREKALYYLENGSLLVWLIYPESETAEVCTRAADGTIQIAPLGQDGVLGGGDVLPGFTLPLKDVYR